MLNGYQDSSCVRGVPLFLERTTPMVDESNLKVVRSTDHS
jgi:hypothetical protein